jgi:hypothetical protein
LLSFGNFFGSAASTWMVIHAHIYPQHCTELKPVYHGTPTSLSKLQQVDNTPKKARLNTHDYSEMFDGGTWARAEARPEARANCFSSLLHIDHAKVERTTHFNLGPRHEGGTRYERCI